MKYPIQLDNTRDALLTDFGKATLKDRYLLPGETFQEMFGRVACAYSSSAAHAQRIYDYMSQLWFMPATPILSNGGADRGLPISCFLNDVEDNLQGIQDTWNENVSLASKGGGIGTYWGGVRSIGEKVKGSGQTSGIIPFIRVMDSLTLAISQGSLRRGSAAVYLDIHHPEIEEFLEIRKPSGDFNRKALNLHHGVVITDEFMEAVREGNEFSLISPKDGTVRKKVSARTLWTKILETRMQTGEPYLLFGDTANKGMSPIYKDLGMRVKQSNLCVEIMLHTGKDYLDRDRTAVCCLSSVNAEKYHEWNTNENFIKDICRFLDNVLNDFIERAPPSMAKAAYAAEMERSIGLGLMGFHSFLQSEGVAFDSHEAENWNIEIFEHLHHETGKASLELGHELGPCPDAHIAGSMHRFTHRMAVAPTASISIICGGTSAGIEPIPANVYTHKTLSGSFEVRNRFLTDLLQSIGMNNRQVWDSIVENNGSVQHLEFLNQDQKDTFRTAFELEQDALIQMAADRTEYICQGQSLNLFVPGDIHKRDLHKLHWDAWEKGVKSLYYLRSMSVQRAAHAGADFDIPALAHQDDECLACQ